MSRTVSSLVPTFTRPQAPPPGGFFNPVQATTSPGEYDEQRRLALYAVFGGAGRPEQINPMHGMRSSHWSQDRNLSAVPEIISQTVIEQLTDSHYMPLRDLAPPRLVNKNRVIVNTVVFHIGHPQESVRETVADTTMRHEVTETFTLSYLKKAFKFQQEYLDDPSGLGMVDFLRNCKVLANGFESATCISILTIFMAVARGPEQEDEKSYMEYSSKAAFFKSIRQREQIIGGMGKYKDPFIRLVTEANERYVGRGLIKPFDSIVFPFRTISILRRSHSTDLEFIKSGEQGVSSKYKPEVDFYKQIGNMRPLFIAPYAIDHDRPPLDPTERRMMRAEYFIVHESDNGTHGTIIMDYSSGSGGVPVRITPEACRNHAFVGGRRNQHLAARANGIQYNANRFYLCIRYFEFVTATPMAVVSGRGTAETFYTRPRFDVALDAKTGVMHCQLSTDVGPVVTHPENIWTADHFHLQELVNGGGVKFWKHNDIPEFKRGNWFAEDNSIICIAIDYDAPAGVRPNLRPAAEIALCNSLSQEFIDVTGQFAMGFLSTGNDSWTGTYNGNAVRDNVAAAMREYGISNSRSPGPNLGLTYNSPPTIACRAWAYRVGIDQGLVQQTGFLGNIVYDGYLNDLTCYSTDYLKPDRGREFTKDFPNQLVSIRPVEAGQQGLMAGSVQVAGIADDDIEDENEEEENSENL
jgi:hypothetical protein